MRKITASEGKYFTQKNIENEGGRTFAITLYLADNDSGERQRRRNITLGRRRWKRALRSRVCLMAAR